MEKTKTLDIKRILIFALDVLVFALVLFAVIKMVGIRRNGALVSGGLGAFKYYTVLSNVFCALSFGILIK